MMISPIKPGTYILAVSGGVDSMALLDLLSGQSGIRLIVAHFDHGIRSDSHEDRRFVEEAADRYGLEYVYGEGHLGEGASEERARFARYDFLEQVRQRYKARAIVTAHHQDDLLETAIINLLRGTGRKGLTSLASRPGLLRPLLDTPKEAIRLYAHERKLKWREDSTNADDRYLRNYIRHNVLPRFDADGRARLLQILEKARMTNRALDKLLLGMMDNEASRQALDRRAFAKLPHMVARELLASWLREQGVRGFDARTLERVTVAAKTQHPGNTIDVIHRARIRVSKDHLALEHDER